MIDTAALKNNILELAFKGELISFVEGDGCISELIQDIPSPSNKRLGLLKKGSDTSFPYTLPDNWEIVPLGKITSYGDTPTKIMASDVESDTWILELEDIEAGGKLLKRTRVGSRQAIGEKTTFNRGQVLYSKLRPYLKKVLQADEDGICTPELIAFDVYAGINPRYIMYYLICNFVDKVINQRSYGVKMPRVDAQFMVNLPVPLPTIAVQNKIVDIIDEAFSAVETINKLQVQYSSDLEVLKSKIIDAGVQGKLTEQLPEDGTAEELLEQIEIQKNTILKNRKGRVDKKIKAIDGDFPYEIPSHWKWIRFGNIGLFKKGPFGSALTKSMFVPKGENTVKVYEQQHAINKDNTLGTYYITREYFDDSMSGFEVLPGDIIVSCAGTIGETYIMPDDIEQGIINQALMRVTLAKGVNRKFFQYYFDANLKKSAQNESNGSAIKNIPPFDVMKNWYFPIPPLEEQERIVEKIENILTIL